MNDRLRSLWDFDDLDVTETRLRKQLEQETTNAGRAEVLTQLARVEGLRDRFEAGDALIDEAVGLAGDDGAARARIDLERGRLRRSGGDPDAARPLFSSAFDIAQDAGQTFIAADAAHMAALVTRSSLPPPPPPRRGPRAKRAAATLSWRGRAGGGRARGATTAPATG